MKRGQDSLDVFEEDTIQELLRKMEDVRGELKSDLTPAPLAASIESLLATLTDYFAIIRLRSPGRPQTPAWRSIRIILAK